MNPSASVSCLSQRKHPLQEPGGDGNKRCKIDPRSPLCQECQLLNLDESFDKAIRYYKKAGEGSIERSEKLCKTADGTHFYNNAFLACRFGGRLSKGPSACPLCEFFRTLRVEPDRQHERYKLLAFLSSESRMFRQGVLRDQGILEEFEDTIFMAVVPDHKLMPTEGYEVTWIEHGIAASGAIYCIEADDEKHLTKTGSHKLVSAREPCGDLCVVRQYLDVCRQSHGKSCEIHRAGETVSRAFRLIDCQSDVRPPPVVLRPWGTHYAALSYVWGDGPKVKWPKTVLDAVKVTRDLGLQYLWVDRVCINQDDEVERDYLLSKMGIIYQQARFTIVAAAGSGSEYGLPGMGSTLRRPHPKYVLDSGSTLLSTLRDPRLDILESVWSTRGWTYQESVLSNRLIVFTDHQIYWECRCMACWESLVTPLIHTESGDGCDENGERGLHGRMADYFLSGIFKGEAYSGGCLSNQENLVILQDEDMRLDYGFPIPGEASLRAQMRGINDHTRAFSKRKLKEEKDTLDAFMGVSTMYERTKELVLLQGIPVWIGPMVGVQCGAQISFALSASSWYHNKGQISGPFVCDPCQRKHLFSSWSWAGWNGVVSWRHPLEYEHAAFLSDLLEVPNTHPVWVADIFLQNKTLSPEEIRLWGMPANQLDCLSDSRPRVMTLLKIRNPQVLNNYDRILNLESQSRYEFRVNIGRAGREQPSTDQAKWDKVRYYIAKRLSYVFVSDTVSEDEWRAKHCSGEWVSVLMFAGKNTKATGEGGKIHGHARFITLKKLRSKPGGWERVGMLWLSIPSGYVGKCRTGVDLLKHIPVQLEPRFKALIVR